MASKHPSKDPSDAESDPRDTGTHSASLPEDAGQHSTDQEAALEYRLLQLVEKRLAGIEQPRSHSKRHVMSDSDWEDLSEGDSDGEEITFAPRTKLAKKSKSRSRRTTDSSEGDTYTRARTKSRSRKRKPKKSKSKKKKKKSSSSDSEEDSSSTSSDSDTKHAGKYARTCSKESKKVLITADRKVRVCTLMRKAIQGHFDTFKPVEVIIKGTERYTGVKGVKQSFAKEMDKEVQLSEEKKRFENVLFTVHRGVLTALTAMAPIANRMMIQNKFTTLSDDINRSMALLAATSNFITYRRFENVYKSVCTEAGKEVAKSQKVTDNNGKEYTLFLAPEPIKGKHLDNTKMFGGQLPYLIKQVETGSKCGKHLGPTKKADDKLKTKDFRHRRFAPRGRFLSRFQPRGRSQRPASNWTDYSRQSSSFRPGQQRNQQPRGNQK